MTTTTTTTATTTARVPPWLSAMVMAVTFLLYVPALFHPFTNWDDPMYVVDNVRLRGSFAALWDPREILVEHAFMEWFPVRDSIAWALFQAFGLNAFVFHLVPVALHALNAALVVRLLRRLGHGDGAAALGGLVWALHPVRVESVAWVAALKDPLFALFFLLALDAHLTFRTSGRGLDLARALALYAGGLLCKSMVIVLPGVVLLVERFVEPRSSWTTTARRVFPFAALTAPFLWLYLTMYAENDVIATHAGGSLSSGLMTSAASLAMYVSKQIVPVALNPRYVFEPVTSVTDPRFLVALAVFAGLGVVVVRNARRQPRLLFWSAWFVGCLVPVLNLVPQRVEVADRYTYVAGIALAGLTALLADSVGARRRAARGRDEPGPRGRWAAVAPGAAASCVLAALAVLAWRQTDVWKSNVSLWQRVADQPGAEQHSFVGNMLGRSLQEAGRLQEAEAAFRIASEAGGSFAYLPMLALAQLRMQPGGDLDEALALVTRARAGAGDDYRVDIAEGNVRAARGETGLAIAAYTRSLERRRQQPLTLWQRGFEYFKLGKTQEGVVDVVDAIGFDPALCPRLLAYRRHLQNKDAAAAAALEQALPPLPCAP